MTITADPRSELGRWCEVVDNMKPGECLDIPLWELSRIAQFEHNDVVFSAPDRIMGNIVGSGYTHSMEIIHLLDRPVARFCRHERTGGRYYTDPDRRKG
jgi:hypothetical protein